MRSFFARISRRTWIIAIAVAALLLFGAGGAYVYAQASGAFTPAGGAFAPVSATTTPGAPGGQKHGRGANGAGKGGLLQRFIAQGISGSIKVKDASAPGGYATIAFAKGAITSVDATSGALSIQEPDGTTQNYRVPATAGIRAGSGKGTIADLQSGEQVVVITKQTQGGAPVVVAIMAQTASGAPAGGATPTTSGV